jgi:hypothetical protein
MRFRGNRQPESNQHSASEKAAGKLGRRALLRWAGSSSLLAAAGTAAENAAATTGAAENTATANTATANTAASRAEARRYQACDVCILGGGSAGTYAALRLMDHGRSVAVVERQARLGGHAETYVDPATGTPIDMGVIVYENVELVRAYLERLGVASVRLPIGSQPAPAYVDTNSGRRLDYAPPGPAEFGAAALAYRQILANNYPYLDDGFELPDPVPAELAQPLWKFIERHRLAALFPTLFQYGQGLGNVLDAPAIYALKNFSAAVVDAILRDGFLVIPTGTSAVYDAAAVQLAGSVHYESEAIAVERGCRGRFPVRVTLSTPEGRREIRCRQLIVAFPPNPAGLGSLDLGANERALLGRFRPNHYSAALIEVAGLPESIQNVGDGTLHDVPRLPGFYGISATPLPGVFNVKFGSPKPLPRRTVQRAIVRGIERLRPAGTFDSEFQQFLAFSDHTPFELMVSGAEVAGGFYARLDQLQGYRDTFYTGAAFQTNDSSLIWRFTERLLPRIVG